MDIPPDLGGLVKLTWLSKYGTKLPSHPTVSRRSIRTVVSDSHSSRYTRSASVKSRLATLRHFNLALLFGITLFFLCVQPTSGHVLPSQQSDALSVRAALHFHDGAALFVPRGDNAPPLENRAALTFVESTKYNVKRQLLASRAQHVRTSSSFSLPSIEFLKRRATASEPANTCACGGEKIPQGRRIGFAILVPILVILSGIFAGLTLGYMSLDETQLRVLMTTGDELQKARARKIMPIRQDGHLLLTTLLIANMITNESLPVIFDPLLPGGIYSVIISTALIVVFSELIPQSTCSRYGLQIGAAMAFPTRCIILLFYPVAWPVSRILHWVLGAHHGIVYRRAELKELVTMHAAGSGRGDLNRDTVMIVGGALDLQEKVVKQAMTPIDQVFMLPFTARLDYATLERVLRSGHSRVPIYQELEVPVQQARSGASTPRRKLNLLAPFTRKSGNNNDGSHDQTGGMAAATAKDAAAVDSGDAAAGAAKTVIRKKIVGTLLVKSCILLDPEDAVPVSSMVINALPTVPGDEPLLNVLNVFQEGRSHMAIVSPRPRRMLDESVADLGSKSHLYHSSQGQGGPLSSSAAPRVDGLGDIDEEKNVEGSPHGSRQGRTSRSSSSGGEDTSDGRSSGKTKHRGWRSRFGLGNGDRGVMEQSVPSDATLDEKAALKKASEMQGEVIGFDLSRTDTHLSFSHEDHDGQPIGIITLEDVLEELLCEEILDEYDDRGNEEQDFRNFIPPPSPERPFKEEDGKGATEPILTLGKDAVTTTKYDAVIGAQSVQGHWDAAKDSTPSESAVAVHPTKDVVTPPPQSPTTAAPMKIVLSKFGIGRDKSLREVPTPAAKEPGQGDGLARRKTEADQTRPVAVSVKAVGGALAPRSGDYFSQPTSSDDTRRPLRSSSMPPDGDQEGAKERSAGSPALGGAVTSDSPWPTTGGPLLTPQLGGRPVVVRAQIPGGPAKIVVANESLLRGRPLIPTAGQQTGGVTGVSVPMSPGGLTGNSAPIAFTPSMPGSASRSQTPVGANRGSRFKSQAASGVGAALLGGTAPTQQRSRPPSSMPPTTTEAGDVEVPARVIIAEPESIDESPGRQQVSDNNKNKE